MRCTVRGGQWGWQGKPGRGAAKRDQVPEMSVPLALTDHG